MTFRSSIGAVLATATVLLVALPGRAQQLFPERYVACHELEAPLVVPRSAVGAADSSPLLEPLPHKSAPPRLQVAPLVVIDVPVAEPVAMRSSASASRSPVVKPLPAAVLGANDYKCLGFPRGRAAIGRVVSAVPGTRWYGHGYGEGYRLDNIAAAGAFGSRELDDALERHLRRDVVAGIEGALEHEALSVKLQSALALADLQSRASGPLVLAFVRDLSRRSWPLLWQDALDPLARLDPELAQTYALDELSELAPAKRSGASETNRVRALLPLVTRPSTRAVTVLAGLSEPLDTRTGDTARHDECLLLAARIRAGDTSLRDDVRAELGTDLRTSRAVTCYSELIAAAFTGESPDEVPVLTYRWRYESIVRLLGRFAQRERAGERSPAIDAAKQALRTWLTAQGTEPEIAAGPSDRRFHPVMRARHLVALTMLGDRAARAELDRLITDPDEHSHAPWIAVHHMLELDLPGAADLAAGLLRRATTERTERHDNTPRGSRGPLLVTEHVQVVDALARRGDARFSLGLLDLEPWSRQAALHWLARRLPAEACELVAVASTNAESKAVEDAYWALSVLGETCAPTMRRIAIDRSQPDVVRGMAIEVLAMMRDPTVPARLRGIDRHHPLHRWAWRAAIIYRTP